MQIGKRNNNPVGSWFAKVAQQHKRVRMAEIGLILRNFLRICQHAFEDLDQSGNDLFPIRYGGIDFSAFVLSVEDG